MIAEIKLALKHSDTLPVAVDLIEEINQSVRDDGKISREERARLMGKFWALVKTVSSNGTH